jgi:hypothetical protein
MFTRKELAIGGIVVAGSGILLYYTFAKPKKPKSDPKPKSDAETTPSGDGENDPLAGLPHCATDKLVEGQVYRDEKDTFFYVGPRQQRFVIPAYPAKPLEIGIEYSYANGLWAIVGIAGLAASAGLLPAAWLGGVLVGGMRVFVSGFATLYSLLPAKVQLYREGKTVYAELRPAMSLWASDDRYFFDEQVPANICRGIVNKPK